MGLKQFVETINEYYNEIGGNGETTIASHDVSPNLRIIYDIDEDTTAVLSIQSIELDLRLGCLCPDGITIKAKLEEIY